MLLVSVSRYTLYFYLRIRDFNLNTLLVIDVEQRSTVSQSDKEEINKNLFRRRIGSDGSVLDSVSPDFNNPS